MNNSPLANSLSVSVRIYRALLVAYPKKFREHYETQMVQVFRNSFKDTYHRHGTPGVIDLWLHICVDLLVTALIERMMERSQYMFSPKVVLWGGLASVFGGLFWILTGLSTNSPAPLVFALVLGLGGLVGLYSRQAGQGGRLGLAGFALGSIGTIVPLAALWWGSVSGLLPNIERDLALVAPAVLIISLAVVILGIGLVLLGITSLHAKTLPRWRGLPLGLGLLTTIFGMIGWLVVYVPLSQGRVPWNPLDPWNPWNPSNFGVYVLFPSVDLLLGVGWIGLGIMLMTEGDAQIPVAQPPPNSA